jgi:hypothetical protein
VLEAAVIGFDPVGRVGSTSKLLGLSGLTIVALCGGWLAHAFGLRVPFAVASALFVVAAGLCVLTMEHFRAWEADQSTEGSAEPVDAVPAG